MRLHNMDHKTIKRRILAAKVRDGLDFVIRYWTIYGTYTVPGKEIKEPLPGSIGFMEFRDGKWQHTGLIETYDIEAIWTENDDCPNCGEFLVDLDGFGEFEEPICEVCAREAWESSRAEGLIADGGVL